MKNKIDFVSLILMLVLLLSLAACGTPMPEEPAPVEQPAEEQKPAEDTPVQTEEEQPDSEPSATEVPPTATLEPTPEPTATPEPVLEPLPPEPQEIIFQAADGQELLGYYYPAAVNPAPLIVLHHWAPGDQNDWPPIAFWLQNRGLQAADFNFPPAMDGPWLDISWFPMLGESETYAVFTFTYRGCEGGCSAFAREGFLLDAQTAMETAYALEGIDQNRIIAAGASIGADGAPDGCLWLNQQHPGACLGGFSFSPGSYLTLDYAQVVTDLEALSPPVPVWCLYADGDTTSAEACQSASGEHYQTTGYSGSEHGMALIDPAKDPNTPQLLLDFIDLTFGR